VAAMAGGVVDLEFPGSPREANLRAIDKPTNADVVQLDGVGAAERFAGEPLESRASCQMPPFPLRRIAFARDLRVQSRMPDMRPPRVGKETRIPRPFI
jgi:hypothetical protein